MNPIMDRALNAAERSGACDADSQTLESRGQTIEIRSRALGHGSGVAPAVEIADLPPTGTSSS